MENNALVGRICFFGSLRNGFRSFPAERQGEFKKYYDNSIEAPWVLYVRKADQVVSYTYVKYGLLTATKDGRSGSHFGISLEINGHYFGDLDFVISDVFRFYINEMLNDEQLIAKNAHNHIGFVPYELLDIHTYLKRWVNQIKTAATEHFKGHLKALDPKIPDFQGRSVSRFHPTSKKEVIQEHFYKYGGFDVSPIYEKKVLTLAKLEQLKKEAATQAQHPQIQFLEQKIEILEKNIAAHNERILQLEKRHGPKEHRSSVSFHKREGRRITRNEFKKYYPAVVVVLLLGIVSLVTLLPTNKHKPPPKTAARSASQPKEIAPKPVDKPPTPSQPTIALADDSVMIINIADEHYKGFLKADKFLIEAMSKGWKVDSLGQVLKHIASFAFDNSQQISKQYKDIDALIDFVKTNNETSLKYINSHVQVNYNRTKASVPYDNNSYWRKAIRGIKNNEESDLLIIQVPVQ